MKRILFSILILLNLSATAQRQMFFITNHSNSAPTNYIPTDANAAAYVSAIVGGGDAVDNTTRIAIDTFVIKMKRFGYWDRCQAIWPQIGGTATSQMWQLKDPRDLDAAYRLTYHGSPTHDYTGIPGWNQVSQYADTHFVPSTAMSGNSDTHFALYSNTTFTFSFGYDLGCDNSVASWALSLQYNNAHSPHTEMSGSADIDMGVSTTKAFYLVSSDATNISTTDYYISGWRNGVSGTPLRWTNAAHPSNAFPGSSLYIGANNDAGVANTYNLRGEGYVSVGTGEWNDDDALNYYNIVNELLTALGR